MNAEAAHIVVTKTKSVATSNADRLSFTAFLAFAIHGLIIFGIHFETHETSENAPSVTVTLATHNSYKTPKKADFLAESNQIGSGSQQKSQEITTDVIPLPFNSRTINDSVITEKRKYAVAKDEDNRIIASSQAKRKINNAKQSDEKQTIQPGEDVTDIKAINTKIASLRAKLAIQRQTYAKIPRQRILTSVSTKASSEAAYLNAWTQKIEAIGNENFPQEALNRKLTGQLRMEVIINFDGSIVAVNLKRSSGHRIFDNAAQQIVRQASPFKAFPPDIRKNYEHLVIIRTWHFNISGLTTSQ